MLPMWILVGGLHIHLEYACAIAHPLGTHATFGDAWHNTHLQYTPDPCREAASDIVQVCTAACSRDRGYPFCYKKPYAYTVPYAQTEFYEENPDRECRGWYRYVSDSSESPNDMSTVVPCFLHNTWDFCPTVHCVRHSVDVGPTLLCIAFVT